MGGSQSDLTLDHHTAANGDGGDASVEVLSREPRLSVYHNFLSNEECKHLIELAKPNLERSKLITVTSLDSVDSVESSIRTSSQASLNRGQDKIIGDIEKRIAKWTLIPVGHGEGLQVIRYQVGQKFDPHYDYFPPEAAFVYTRRGGNRIATVLMYLSDVEEGGETVFPYAKKINDPLKQGISVKPKMGDAVLFWNMKPDGSLDPLSLHGSSPVIKGNKWCCQKLIHVNKFN